MCLELSQVGVPELFAAYAKAQADMGDVLKVSTNPAFKSRYADLAAVVEAVMPALSKHGLALIQAPAFNGETVSVETVIAHTAGGFMRSTINLRPTKADPQGVGSAITYGRRYALMAMAGVAPEDDDGNGASAAPDVGGSAKPAKFKESSAELKRNGTWDFYSNGMKSCKTAATLEAFHATPDAKNAYDRMPTSWQEQVAELNDQILADIKASEGERV